MASGFAASLFGLFSSLVVGLLARIAGQAAGVLKHGFESWLAGVVQIGDEEREEAMAPEGLHDGRARWRRVVQATAATCWPTTPRSQPASITPSGCCTASRPAGRSWQDHDSVMQTMSRVGAGLEAADRRSTREHRYRIRRRRAPWSSDLAGATRDLRHAARRPAQPQFGMPRSSRTAGKPWRCPRVFAMTSAMRDRTGREGGHWPDGPRSPIRWTDCSRRLRSSRESGRPGSGGDVMDDESSGLASMPGWRFASSRPARPRRRLSRPRFRKPWERSPLWHC